MSKNWPEPFKAAPHTPEEYQRWEETRDRIKKNIPAIDFDKIAAAGALLSQLKIGTEKQKNLSEFLSEPDPLDTNDTRSLKKLPARR